jgi:hypothetical protein
MVSDATADGTIIDGGFIRTSLIEVDNLFAVNASITATLTLGVGGEFVFAGGKLNNDGIAFNYATAINPDQSIQWLRDAPDGGGWGAYVQGIDEGGGYYSLNLNARSGVNIGASLDLTVADAIKLGNSSVTGAGVTSYGLITMALDATNGNHLVRRSYADSRYGQLGSANTWTGAQTVPNATANGHALNRITADGRYGRLASANTWTLAQTFVNEITINDEIRMGTAGANKPIVFATQDGGSNDITVSLQAQNGGTAGNKTVTIPNATGTLVTTANYNQDIAGNKNFTGTLRAGGSTGQTTVVDTGAVILTFTKGLLTGVS